MHGELSQQKNKPLNQIDQVHQSKQTLRIYTLISRQKFILMNSTELIQVQNTHYSIFTNHSSAFNVTYPGGRLSLSFSRGLEVLCVRDCTDHKQQQHGNKWVVPSMMHNNTAARPRGRRMESSVCTGVAVKPTGSRAPCCFAFLDEAVCG